MRDYLKSSDFDECPVWRLDKDADTHFPVRSLNDIPELVRDLRILAEFTAPNGQKMLGRVGGIDRIFAIGLFVGDNTFIINKNMPKDAREQAEAFLQASGLSNRLSYETLFPLRYETRWGGEVFNDFSGVFEMPP